MKVCHQIIVVLGIGFVADSAFADDWTRFRGSNGNSVASETKHPAQWSEDSNVAWKVKIPGRGWSQPVVAGDNVFVTTSVTENEEKPKRFDRGLTPDAKNATQSVYQWKVFCLSLKTGKVLWERTPYEGKPAMPKHRGNTYASETPVTDGERVIAYFGMKGVACYDLSGKLSGARVSANIPLRPAGAAAAHRSSSVMPL